MTPGEKRGKDPFGDEWQERESNRAINDRISSRKAEEAV